MPAVTITGMDTGLVTYQGDESTIYLAFYSDQDMILDDGLGDYVPKGSPYDVSSFFKIIACPVVAGVVTIPDIPTRSTEDSNNPTNVIVAHWLTLVDGNYRPIQPFLKPFRIPAQPTPTTWGNLMDSMGQPQLIIDPTVVRTVGRLQKYHATYGLVDSIAQETGSTIALAGSQTISGTLGVSGLSTLFSLLVTTDLTIGDDLNAGGDGFFDGDVHATHFYGDISTATGIPSDSLIGNTWTSATSLAVNYDSDANGSGEFSIARGMVNRMLMANSGFTIFYNGLQSALWDKGGAVFNLKAYGATGDGVTDDTAAIAAWIADIYASGNGKGYAPPGDYLTSSRHEITGGITLEGAGGSYPGIAFGLTDTNLTVFHLTAEDECVFQIMPRAVNVAIRDISAIADSETGTSFIFAEGSNHDPEADPAEDPTSSWGHVFHRLYTRNFEAGIKVISPSDATWQFDRVTITSCAFVEGKYGIYTDSPDCDQWAVHGSQLGASAGMNYGAYHKRVGTINYYNCYGAGGGANSRSLFYFTSARANVGIYNCWCEPFDYFLELEESESGNLGSPIVLQGNGIPAMYLGHSSAIFSSGNTYYGEDNVTAGEDSNNNVIHSYGDIVISGSEAPTTPLDASPFALIKAVDSNRVTELGLSYNVIDARSHGLEIKGRVGVNTATPGAGLSGSPTVLEVAVTGNDYPFFILQRAGASGGTINRKWAFLIGSGGELLITDLTAAANRLIIDTDGTVHVTSLVEDL